jgi:hypothetical protein
MPLLNLIRTCEFKLLWLMVAKLFFISEKRTVKVFFP